MLIRFSTFRRLPVKKLSTQRTSSPISKSFSHKWDPKKPAPPVTRTLLPSSMCIDYLIKDRSSLAEGTGNANCNQTNVLWETSSNWAAATSAVWFVLKLALVVLNAVSNSASVVSNRRNVESCCFSFRSSIQAPVKCQEDRPCEHAKTS